MPNRADLNLFTQIAANNVSHAKFRSKQHMCDDTIGEDFAG